MNGGRHRGVLTLAVLLCVVLGVSPGAPRTEAHAESPQAEPGTLRVAMLRYGSERKSSVCFSNNFLRVLEFETGIRIDRRFADVDLASDALFEFPFAIMTGEGAFTLSEAEVQRMREYVAGGGFLLVSAGCSNEEWSRSMEAGLQRAFPDHPVAEMPFEHDVFHTVFDIESFECKKRSTQVRVGGVEIDGRLGLVFSPEGLNDTRNAGGDCCCCGANEILNAKYVNANIVAYALMH